MESKSLPAMDAETRAAVEALEQRTAKAKMGAEMAYYERASPHYRDNIRFTWAIDTINKEHDDQLIELGVLRLKEK